jgi:uncharacterized protein YcgI (DUF1989 family)
VSTPESEVDNSRFSTPRAMQSIAAKRGAAFEVREGERIQIVDQAGKQTAILVAFKKDDHSEWISTTHTSEGLGSIMLRLNGHIVSNRRNWMMRLEEDTVGRHDMLLPACDGRRYLDYYGLVDHPNCKDNLTTALAEFGIPYEPLPDPINLFMNVGILGDGAVEVREPLSEAGDFVVLRALTDLVVAISACPNDRNAQNEHTPTDLLVRIYAD